MGTIRFKCTGALSPDHDARLYIQRPEDMEVRDRLVRVGLECVLISLIGARQMGKTSLLNRLLHEYGRPYGTWYVINIDLSELAECTSTQWYQRLIVECCEQIYHQDMVLSLVELQEHCERLFIPLYSARGWAEVIRTICQRLSHESHLILAFDELSTIPQNQWEVFFSQIRSIHQASQSPNKRPEYRRLGIILAGSFVPSHLIKGENSPFNVSIPIYMSSAQRQQLLQIQDLLRECAINLEMKVVDLIFDWTDGILYHIQRFCELLVKMKESSIDIEHIDTIAHNIMFNDNYIHHIKHYLEKHTHLQKIVHTIYKKPLRSTRNVDAIAMLEIKGVIRYNQLQDHWNITNRLCRQGLQELFSTEENFMTGLEPIYIAALTKAVDFLFGEAGNLLKERREARTILREPDDTPPLKGEVSKKEDLLPPQNIDIKNIYLRDLPEEVDHILRLIEGYRRNRRFTEDKIQFQGGLLQSPTMLRNELIETDKEIKHNIQRLKDFVQKVYGHQLNLVGLD